MELDSRKKSIHDRMIRSNSFDTQEVREIGRKKAGESRGIPIWWMSSRWKERNAKTRRDRSCEGENLCQSEEGASAWDRQLCLGQWQWKRKGWRQSHEIQRERKESRRTNETPSRGEEEDEEGEPAIERRREYTVFGFDLGEREEQVFCHSSDLALAMTDKARREAEM